MVEWEGRYEVSNLGRVRGLVGSTMRAGRSVTFQREIPEIMATSRNGRGRYEIVRFKRPGKYQTYYVHRLVLHAFVGPPPAGFECAHLDGNKNNNSLDNLRWVTRRENHSHKVGHGTAMRGERHPLARLTPEHVRAIRECLRLGAMVAPLAKAFGVTDGTLHRIEQGLTWSHTE